VKQAILLSPNGRAVLIRLFNDMSAMAWTSTQAHPLLPLESWGLREDLYKKAEHAKNLPDALARWKERQTQSATGAPTDRALGAKRKSWPRL